MTKKIKEDGIYFHPEEWNEMNEAMDIMVDFVRKHSFELNRTAVGKCRDLCDYVEDYFEKQRKKDESIAAQIQFEKGAHTE